MEIVRIGTTDISSYNAKLLTYVYTPATVNNTTVTPYNSMMPILTDTEIMPGKLVVTIHVRGSSQAACQASIAALLMLLHKQSEIDLDDGYLYRCIYNSATVTRRMDTLMEVAVTLTAVRRKPIVTATLTDGINTVFCSGSVPVRCLIQITPTATAAGCTVFGIAINNLTAGRIIIIDGFSGTVTEDGANKFLDTDMTDFPMLQPGDNTVTVDGNVIAVLQYYPTYL